MSAGARILLAVIVGGTLLAAATVAAAAAAIYGGGTIAVQVEAARGSAVSVRVPAGLADLALGLVPGTLVTEALRDAPEELEDCWDALQDSWDAFARAPDFVMLEVAGPDHGVRVEKRGGRLLVDVDTDGERIRVAVPVSTLRKLIHRLA